MSMSKQEYQEMKWKMLKVLTSDDEYPLVPKEIVQLGEEEIYRWIEQRVDEYLKRVEFARQQKRAVSATQEVLDIPTFLRNRNRHKKQNLLKRLQTFIRSSYKKKTKEHKNG
ncbi:hypothetical protein [Fredinandcohnia onubensis]|uniref:hypothetical protein n=1 Tax=Fredinandcohnia onubensis TaxID=1571209 RepID=UPI000C0C06A2|nr:hypothetical protein [Fredinandcohnia onubensis]